jgi:peptide/nickel transport system substrate-binding protein
MPSGPYTPCLAHSWTTSEDNLSYEFVVRDGAKFHNGDPVTAEDVKFSFERYRGASHDLMKSQVAAIETPDARRVVFKLKKPWPDFLTFYSNASGAGWIVPKKYVEQVGEEKFKNAPVGAGPYKFVSFTPGVELVLEAFDGYWRKTPQVKRIVATRLASSVVKGGAYVYGNYPDIDALFAQQADELDQKKRAALLAKIQQLTYEKAIYAPVWQLGFLNGIGPRGGESTFGLIPGLSTPAHSRTSQSRESRPSF